MIKQICAYCNAELGTIEGADPEVLISHGICEKCLPKMAGTYVKTFTEFLDSIKAPVFVVDGNVQILTVNAAGQNMLSKSSENLHGRLGGEAIDCVHSKEPGGCGKTIHCKSCAIRRSVATTSATGNPCLKVPAYADLGDVTRNTKVRFLISTRKAGAVVLLQIDEAAPAASHADKAAKHAAKKASA